MICSSWPVPSVVTTERLRLAAGEERRAVRARQHADFDRDRADGLGVAAVDARLAFEDGAAHDVLLELLEQLAGERLARRPSAKSVPIFALAASSLFVARLLLRLGIGGARDRPDDRGAQLVFDRLGFAALLRQRSQGSLARGFGQLDDRLDHRLECSVAEHHGAEHDLLRQLLRLRFDHQHAFGGAGDDEVELRISAAPPASD